MIIKAFPSILELQSEFMRYKPMRRDQSGNYYHHGPEYSQQYWNQIKNKIKQGFNINKHDDRLELANMTEETKKDLIEGITEIAKNALGYIER